MVGKHARERRFADRGLKLAWFGLRELLVVVVIGVALPGAILVLLPRLRDQVDTLDVGAFLLAAAWPALACVIMWALGWRHPARLASPTIALLGAVTASPAAYAGLQEGGYEQMARAGLITLGAGLVLAGLVLAGQRVYARRNHANGRSMSASDPLLENTTGSLPAQRSAQPGVQVPVADEIPEHSTAGHSTLGHPDPELVPTGVESSAFPAQRHRASPARPRDDSPMP